MGGPEEAKASGQATVDMMKQLPTDDDVLGKGLCGRIGGRSIRPIYSRRRSRRTWDYQFVIDTIPAEQWFRR